MPTVCTTVFLQTTDVSGGKNSSLENEDFAPFVRTVVNMIDGGIKKMQRKTYKRPKSIPSKHWKFSP